ncbi:hypothetical protein EPD60_01335 [Flaviaesturariibacter flavus]|uniref:Uncharacterized protein n=1 Tax=Flaviaesturariibacter flavus TaxID=2502780 RepID=A0A4R1BNU6_9BACT|nr:hypothetical protein [Flaviaesturariibacter flavus]TCJ19088.1 hypothetical protein EPD60_01335 [Flaviaesturariibacter flavus]
MRTIISEYFIREIADWRCLIDFYLEEIKATEPLLRKVLGLNTVRRLAEKTERHLANLEAARLHFRQQQERIEGLEPDLYQGRSPAADDLVQPSLVSRMKVLRRILYHAERDYLGKKYRCDDFLADAIAIQNNIGGD